MNKFITILFFIMLCFGTTAVFGQVTTPQADSVFTPIFSIKGQFNNFTVDNLGNIYLITAANQLKKINPQGDSMAVYNDVKRYGYPSSIDVSNPLKILLYYRNYSTVVILDRMLNPRNTINFRKENIFTVQSIATSYDNNIWLFDEQDYKLKKIDDDGKLLSETIDFRMIFDSIPAPAQLIDQENFVYLYDTAKGFYIFDYYGSLKNRLPFLSWSSPAVSGRTVYGFRDNSLFSYELNSLALKTYPLPLSFSGYNSIKAMNGKVYLHKEEGIDIYQVK